MEEKWRGVYFILGEKESRVLVRKRLSTRVRKWPTKVISDFITA